MTGMKSLSLPVQLIAMRLSIKAHITVAQQERHDTYFQQEEISSGTKWITDTNKMQKV